MPRTHLVASILAATTLTACGGATAPGSGSGAAEDGNGTADTVGVQAAFYPLAFVAERVGGDRATVDNLTSPGVEPHDLEVTARQVGALVDSDLVIYLEGFQPALDDAIEQNAAEQALEVTDVAPLAVPEAADEHTEDEAHAEDDGHGHDLAGDPHLWLDPTRLLPLADAIADRLADIDPGGASGYSRRAAELADELTALDEQFQDGLADCERDTIVTSHAAFGYLAERYDLEQVPISGLSPEAEPTAGRIAEVQDVVRDRGVTTIFYETLVSPKIAETMADDLGVQTAVLDPLEGLADPESGDYFSVMRANLEALRAANGCR